jgi:hypothetical protein
MAPTWTGEKPRPTRYCASSTLTNPSARPRIARPQTNRETSGGADASRVRRTNPIPSSSACEPWSRTSSEVTARQSQSSSPALGAVPAAGGGSRAGGVRRDAAGRWWAGDDLAPVEHAHGLGVRAGGAPDAVADRRVEAALLLRQAHGRAPGEPDADGGHHADRGQDDEQRDCGPHCDPDAADARVDGAEPVALLSRARIIRRCSPPTWTGRPRAAGRRTPRCSGRVPRAGDRPSMRPIPRG